MIYHAQVSSSAELHPTIAHSIFTDGAYSYAPRAGPGFASNNDDTKKYQEVKICDYFDKHTLRRIVGDFLHQIYTDLELESLAFQEDELEYRPNTPPAYSGYSMTRLQILKLIRDTIHPPEFESVYIMNHSWFCQRTQDVDLNTLLTFRIKVPIY